MLLSDICCSCCVDFTSAQHVSSDAIIHFGGTCFSKQEEIIPHLKIHEKYDLNVEEFFSNVNTSFESVKSVTIVVDTSYLCKIGALIRFFNIFRVFLLVLVVFLDEIRRIFSGKCSVKSIEENLVDFDGEIIVYVGGNYKKVMNLQFLYSSKLFFTFSYM